MTGIPQPEVKWFKDWIPLREDGHVEIRHYEPDSYVLNINNAEPDDSGVYICKARNDAGAITTTALVHVEPNEESYICKTIARRSPETQDIHEIEWEADLTRIRRQLERVKHELGEAEKNELSRRRAHATYHVKYRRTSDDYYDIF